MKKFTKFLSVLVILSVLILSFALVACNVEEEPATEDATFDLVIRQYNGYDDATWTADITGTVLATLKVPVKAGQTYVSEALASVATKEGSTYKISFNDTDYIIFSESTYNNQKSWMLTNGHFEAEKGYIADDFANSYMALDGAYSNGVTADAVAGLKVYTIVIDGYDGNTGVAKVWPQS